MNFDKESNSDDLFSLVWGGKVGFRQKKNSMYSLLFVLKLYIKFQVPSSSVP